MTHSLRQPQYKSQLINSYPPMIKEEVNLESIIRHFNKVKRKKNIICATTDSTRAFSQTVKGKSSDTKLLNINMKTLTLSYLKNLQASNQLSAKAVQIKDQFAQMPPSFQSFSYLFFGSAQQNSPLAHKRPIQDVEKRQTQEIKKRQAQEVGKRQIQEVVDKNMWRDGGLVDEDLTECRQARRILRAQCSNYYRSTLFIKKMMSSGRMYIENKLIILKFLGRIEEMGHKRFKQKQNQWKNMINY